MWSYMLWRLMAALCIVGAIEAEALEFTADQVTKINGRTQKANIYYRDTMWRIEHHTLGPVNVSIVRKDKQVVWLLLSRMRHFKPCHTLVSKSCKCRNGWRVKSHVKKSEWKRERGIPRSFMK